MDAPYRTAYATTTESPKPIPKKESPTDGDSFGLIAVLALVAFFAFWHTPSSSKTSERSEGGQKKPLSKAETEYRKLAEKERATIHALKTIAIRQRELENDIRKAELDSFSSDSSNPFDSDLKTDKLRMKLEELGMSEEKKTEELEQIRSEMARLVEIGDGR